MQQKGLGMALKRKTRHGGRNRGDKPADHAFTMPGAKSN